MKGNLFSVTPLLALLLGAALAQAQGFGVIPSSNDPVTIVNQKVLAAALGGSLSTVRSDDSQALMVFRSVRDCLAAREKVMKATTQEAERLDLANEDPTAVLGSVLGAQVLYESARDTSCLDKATFINKFADYFIDVPKEKVGKSVESGDRFTMRARRCPKYSSVPSGASSEAAGVLRKGLRDIENNLVCERVSELMK